MRAKNCPNFHASAAVTPCCICRYDRSVMGKSQASCPNLCVERTTRGVKRPALRLDHQAVAWRGGLEGRTQGIVVPGVGSRGRVGGLSISSRREAGQRRGPALGRGRIGRLGTLSIGQSDRAGKEECCHRSNPDPSRRNRARLIAVCRDTWGRRRHSSKTAWTGRGGNIERRLGRFQDARERGASQV